MTMQKRNRRLAAVKIANAINEVEGAPVSLAARRLSAQWARGEISGVEMKSKLLAAHRRPVPSDK